MKPWLFAALSVMVSAPSLAEDCAPLKLITSVPLSSSAEGRSFYAPVQLGGLDKRLLIDTGAVISMVSADLVKSLNVDTYSAGVRVYDLTGEYTERYARVPFKIGRLVLGNTQFMVSPGLNHMEAPDVVGYLGADFLTQFDVSLDPAGKKLDLLNPVHCPDKVVYWPAKVIAKVPVERLSDGHLVVKVELDGKPFKAVLDTGAWGSTIRIKPAKMLLGVTPGGADAPASGELNGAKGATTYRHVFRSLSFDGVAITNPSITLIPDMLDDALSSTPTGSKIKVKDDSDKPDMLLGMDILRHFHIYIAYKDRFVYLTPIEAAAKPQ